tara:strand:- start:470 stop:643 length:174 start_codon:yes stop_codon:yes gene_type:complete
MIETAHYTLVPEPIPIEPDPPNIFLLTLVVVVVIFAGYANRAQTSTEIDDNMPALPY